MKKPDEEVNDKELDELKQAIAHFKVREVYKELFDLSTTIEAPKSLKNFLKAIDEIIDQMQKDERGDADLLAKLDEELKQLNLQPNVIFNQKEV